MNEVFVLSKVFAYEGGEVVGVFDSEAKAWEAAENMDGGDWFEVKKFEVK